jgi:hypothetical protein
MASPGMFYSMIVQMARMIPNQLERHKHRLHRQKHRIRNEITFGAPEGRCGCCPSCREFVYIEPSGPGDLVPCPRCGKPIRLLNPLGPAEPPGVWDRQMDG